MMKDSKKYDFLIIGSGLYGCTFAYEARKKGYKCLIIEKRGHIGGNLYCEEHDGIIVHKYGPHIFHTSNKKIWDYVNNISDFNNFINSPIANYNGELYNLPFNMNTFHELWGCVTPKEAKMKINAEKKEYSDIVPKNLKEQAIFLVGSTIFEKLVRGYTEKQWGRKCEDLPPEIIKRLPLRFSYNNNYFNDKYQGIPSKGYNDLLNKMVEGCDILLKTDYFANKEYYDSIANIIIYTGPIDRYYNYAYGKLDYRTVEFTEEKIDIPNFQGNAVVNYTDEKTPYTRIIEHKHFSMFSDADIESLPYTIITKEYPKEWDEKSEPYYPINDKKNTEIKEKYMELAKKEPNVIFGGRLAEYKYYDMAPIIENVLDIWENGKVESITNL